MIKVHHLNCGILHAPPNPKASCHCLLLEEAGTLALVDTGIGLLEVKDPQGRVGEELIRLAGFQFDEALTAVRQIEQMGFRAEDVHHIILTHLDNDHAGGLADFPHASVHVAKEEWEAFLRGSYRYNPMQLAHQPPINTYAASEQRWFGLEARRIALPFSSEVYLVPLFGHTLGHCGVAIEQEAGWLLHVGDAYYLRAELTDPAHPVDALASLRAEDNTARRLSLGRLRALVQLQGETIKTLGYHDFSEFDHEMPSCTPS